MTKYAHIGDQRLAFPDDATDDEMAQALEQVAPKTAAQRVAGIKARLPGLQADAQQAQQDAQQQAIQANPVAQVADAAPQVGGMVGGLMGGAGGTVAGLGVGGVPGAIGGAALGGAAGESLKQLTHQALGDDAVPQTAGSAFKQIAEQGGLQGAFEGAGLGIGKLASVVAKPVMMAAIGLAKRGVPELAQTAIDEGIAQSPMGLAKLKNRIGDVGGQIDDLARKASASGAKIHPLQLLRRVPDMINDAMNNVGTVLPLEKSAAIHDEMMRFLQNQGMPQINSQAAFNRWARNGGMDISKAINLRRAADKIAEPIYKQIAKNEPVALVDQVRAHFYKSVADEARNLINSIPAHQGGQAMAELNQLERRLIQLKGAMDPRAGWMGVAAKGAAPVAAFGAGAALPGGSPVEHLKRGAIAAAVVNPLTFSHAALALSNPAIAPLIPTLLRTGQSVAESQKQ